MSDKNIKEYLADASLVKDIATTSFKVMDRQVKDEVKAHRDLKADYESQGYNSKASDLLAGWRLDGDSSDWLNQTAKDALHNGKDPNWKA